MSVIPRRLSASRIRLKLWRRSNSPKLNLRTTVQINCAPFFSIGKPERIRYLLADLLLSIAYADERNRENKNAPVATVVVMACNRADYLERTIKSILKYQTSVASKYPLFVSQDGPDPNVKRKALSYDQVSYMQKMINGMTVSRWACINFSRSVQESVARGFCSELAQMCQVSDMEFNTKPVIPIYNARPEQVEKALKHVYHASMNKTKGRELELVLAILPDNNGSLYVTMSLTSLHICVCTLYYVENLTMIPLN
ncbi:hypothetical protein F8388_003485 [Cannabis sativa]|uniref:Alpha-1,3-mannosyl-glycoprotein 2-beta-N-acetylglucosaminyltransferase n=1 Tax=Cannabis sativa TaxID=3483 RepID=A0A7J6F0I9_CANSA|nr:hypothetical protein F8388_003485 [Cannabis sativa]